MTSGSILRAANGMPSALRFTSFAIAAGVVLAIIGPFGTMPVMAAPVRLVHWVLSSLAIGALTWAGVVAIGQFWRPGAMPLWVLMLVAAAAAAPGAWIVEACLRIWSPSAFAHARWPQLFARCLFLNEVLSLIGRGLFRRATSPTEEVGAGAGPPSAGGIAERLPLPLQSARIIALCAEDHYLRVHTDRGEALIHMRISDAEALLRGTDGLRIHRSHWVLRSAVRRATSDGGRWLLHLDDGMSLPVGRSRVKTLAQAGWLRTSRG